MDSVDIGGSSVEGGLCIEGAVIFLATRRSPHLASAKDESPLDYLQ